MVLRHLPEGTHSLAPRPGTLGRLTFRNGPRDRICTCTFEGLSFVPLRWATRGWCPRSDLHRHSARFKGAVSALDYVGEMVGMKGLAPPRLPDSESGPSAIRVKPHARKLVHPAGLPPADSPFEAEDDNNFTTDASLNAELGTRSAEQIPADDR